MRTAGTFDSRVMTQNLYLGADLTPALPPTNTPEFLGAVAGIYGSSRANDFPIRAAADRQGDRPQPAGPDRAARGLSVGTCRAGERRPQRGLPEDAAGGAGGRVV